MHLPSSPVVYEIHTAAFLRKLSTAHGQEITLHNIPDNEWDRLAELGVHAVWLMGVWQRSPAGAAITKSDSALVASLKEAAPELTDNDIIGSAYCIRNYAADPQFGGDEGLQAVREQLANHGIGLLLDFVPNHVAPDHPWTIECPEYFIAGNEQDLAEYPKNFVRLGQHIYAKGKDPHFEPWPDVIQLNAFAPAYRHASIETLKTIAGMCDGVRCDMAMLMMNEIFAGTWQGRGVERQDNEYWHDVIPAVRQSYPEFLFLAEAYWDTQRQLLDQGFDYCYDKTLYDLLLTSPASAIREYVSHNKDYLDRLCHFIENHDEPRAVSMYETAKSQAAAAAVTTLPGMRLIHDGQLEGYKTKIPVHVAVGPAEETQPDLYDYYRRLLKAISAWQFEGSEWHMYDLPNDRMVAWHWLEETAMRLVFINYSGQATECNAYIPKPDCEDALTGEKLHSTQAVNDSFVVPLQLEPWQARILNVSRN